MKTFFIRHTSELDVDNATLTALWRDNRIAIHFPFDRNGKGERDSTSVDPNDYDIPAARDNIARLRRLATTGGYIFAVYRHQPGAKIGIVDPGSTVRLVHGTWGNKFGNGGREAVLKTLQLSRWTNLDAAAASRFKYVQPRKGTLCEWHMIGERVRMAIEGVAACEVGSLTPDLQEVLCMEFLRTEKAASYGLPRLHHTLAPIGRTMKDLDIIGLTADGREIFAQVTFHTEKTGAWKLQKLDAFRSSNSHTIFFCLCEQAHVTDQGHRVFPIQYAFKELMETASGKRWFETVTTGTRRSTSTGR